MAASGRPVIAQLVEHLTVESCRHQMVPGSIPGDRIVFEVAFEQGASRAPEPLQLRSRESILYIEGPGLNPPANRCTKNRDVKNRSKERVRERDRDR